MSVTSVSSGNNSQAQAILQQAQAEKAQRTRQQQAAQQAKPQEEAPKPTVNANGQKVGSSINATA